MGEFIVCSENAIDGAELNFYTHDPIAHIILFYSRLIQLRLQRLTKLVGLLALGSMTNRLLLSSSSMVKQRSRHSRLLRIFTHSWKTWKTFPSMQLLHSAMAWLLQSPLTKRRYQDSSCEGMPLWVVGQCVSQL